MHGSAQGNALYISSACGGIRAEVCFVEQDDRPRAAVPRDGQIALDASEIKLTIQRADHKYRVQVRGHNLFPQFAPRHLAGKLRSPGEDMLDPCPALFGARHDGHPVAHGGKIFPIPGLMFALAGHFRQILSLRGSHSVETLEFLDNAGRGEPGLLEAPEMTLEKRIPPHVVETKVKLHGAHAPSSGTVSTVRISWVFQSKWRPSGRGTHGVTGPQESTWKHGRRSGFGFAEVLERS